MALEARVMALSNGINMDISTTANAEIWVTDIMPVIDTDALKLLPEQDQVDAVRVILEAVDWKLLGGLTSVPSETKTATSVTIDLLTTAMTIDVNGSFAMEASDMTYVPIKNDAGQNILESVSFTQNTNKKYMLKKVLKIGGGDDVSYNVGVLGSQGIGGGAANTALTNNTTFKPQSEWIRFD